jgi:hypothetical protein
VIVERRKRRREEVEEEEGWHFIGRAGDGGGGGGASSRGWVRTSAPKRLWEGGKSALARKRHGRVFRKKLVGTIGLIPVPDTPGNSGCITLADLVLFIVLISSSRTIP